MKVSQHGQRALCGVLLSLSTLLHAQTVSRSADLPVVAESSFAPQKVRPRMSFDSGGMVLSTHGGATKLRIHGYIQADDRMFWDNIHGKALDQFLVRRIRPLFEGTLFNALDFRFMPDFGQNNPQIQEAYVELKSMPFAKLRVGKFKEPIGLEVLRSDRELTFAERSLASDLAPLRYVGVQLGGSILSNSISYEAGYFDGSEDGSNGNFQWTQSHELAVRGFFLPFAKTGVKAAHQFGVGLAGSLGDQVGSIAGLKTVGQTTFFKFTSTAMANGRHDRVSPQAYYYFGPVGLISEYVISTQEVLNNSARRRLRNQAWQAAGSVMLTGEKNGYGGIRPRNSFDPSKGFRSLGAVELAARYSQLQIDPGAFPIFANPATAGREGQEYGIGANWYLNRFVKLVIDYEQTSFKMATGNSTPLHSEKVWMSRIQLAF